MNQDEMLRAEVKSPAGETMSSRDFLTLSELAWLTGVTPQVIGELLENELIEPSERAPEPHFTLDILPQVCRAIRLHRGLDISFCSMGLVLDLLKRIEELEQRLKELENRR